MTENNLYVSINEPDEIRKYVLESSKVMIQSSKSYEALKKIRIEKLEYVTKYNQNANQISILAARLKKEFPEAGIRIPPTKEIVAPRIQETPKKTVRKNEVDAIDAQLAEIEEKLNSL